MKLKFYSNQKLFKNNVHISVFGQMRFKTDFAKEFSIEKGQRWEIGWDADEETISAIYMVRNKNGTDGFKVSYSNSAHHINIKHVLLKLGIKTPIQCKCEEFDIGEYRGIKVIFS
jgi:hypothetical protein